MKVEDFLHPSALTRHCSFELKKGEILSVAGLVGAQRTELMSIFGLHTASSVNQGSEVAIKQPRDAINLAWLC